MNSPTIIGKATLYQMDCMAYMATLPDNAFNLAITDPPYGIGEHGGKNRSSPESAKRGIAQKVYVNKGWDNETPKSEYFAEIQRVSKNQIIWGGNYFIDYLKSTSCMLVWDKKSSDGSDFADCELAWTSFKTAVRKFKYDWVGFGYLNNPHGERKEHPTQKPVALYSWLLKNYAKQGDKILDTHLGSMSIAIACLNMGFEITGCELDADYFAAGVKRVEQSQKQSTLFAPAPPAIQQMQAACF